jgi:hypothetical protein
VGTRWESLGAPYAGGIEGPDRHGTQRAIVPEAVAKRSIRTGPDLGSERHSRTSLLPKCGKAATTCPWGAYPPAVSATDPDRRAARGVADDGLTSPVQTDPTPETNASGRSRFARSTVVGAVLTVLIGVSAAGIAAVLHDDEAPHPAVWDSRVEPLAAFVEAQLGLQFDHPVYVDLLTTKQFRERSQPSDIDRNGRDRSTLDRTVPLLRALSVVPPDLDLYNATDQLRGSSVLGTYSVVDERIHIRGEDFTPAVRFILVHELVHALRDQVVDLEARFADLGRDPARQSAFRALLEGDADRVQSAWRDSLDDEGLRELDDELARLEPPDSAGSAQVPDIVKSFAAAPTLLGKTLITVVLGQGRRGALDDLFLTPPTTEEQLLDPWALVHDHQGYLSTDLPVPPRGDEPADHGTFGAVSWLLVLAERLSPSQALRAAEGWGGDAYVAFDHDGDECLRIRYAADSKPDRLEMRAALSKWIQRGPAGSARLAQEGRELWLEACATLGGESASDFNGPRTALTLAILHSEVSAELARSGYDFDEARCGADLLIDRYRPRAIRNLLPREPQVHRLVMPCLPAGSG